MQSKVKVLIHKGIDRYKQGKYDEALEFYDRAMELDQNSSDLWNNRGVALFAKELVDESFECYNKALELDPKNTDAKRNKGYVLQAIGNLSEALALYDEIVSGDGEGRDWEFRAALLIGLGMLEEAARSLEQAMMLDENPRYEEEMEVLISLIRARGPEPSSLEDT